MNAVALPVRHHNRPQVIKPVHARLDRAIKRTVRTFDNPGHAAHWMAWAAQHLGGKR